MEIPVVIHGDGSLLREGWTGREICGVHLSVVQPFPLELKVLIVTDSEALDWSTIANQCWQWLLVDYSLRLAEWQYRPIKPCLMLEEFLQVYTG